MLGPFNFFLTQKRQALLSDSFLAVLSATHKVTDSAFISKASISAKSLFLYYRYFQFLIDTVTGLRTQIFVDETNLSSAYVFSLEKKYMIQWALLQDAIQLFPLHM